MKFYILDIIWISNMLDKSSRPINVLQDLSTASELIQIRICSF